MPIGMTYESLSVGSWTKTRLESSEAIVEMQTYSYLQLISVTDMQIIGDINGEGEVAAPVKGCILTIDEDCGFVVNGSEVEQNAVVGEGRRYIESCGEP